MLPTWKGSACRQGERREGREGEDGRGLDEDLGCTRGGVSRRPAKKRVSSVPDEPHPQRSTHEAEAAALVAEPATLEAPLEADDAADDEDEAALPVEEAEDPDAAGALDEADEPDEAVELRQESDPAATVRAADEIVFPSESVIHIVTCVL